MGNGPPLPHVVTRETLYEEVWRVPLTKLAPKYGLRAPELTKLCDLHQIPRPPSGYWSMVRFGCADERPPLPPPANPNADRITMAARPSRHTPLLAVSKAVQDPQADNNHVQVRPRPLVPDRLESPHRLTVEAREQLKAAKPDKSGLVRTRAESALDIRVAPASVPRALRLFDTLVKAWEAMGGNVSTGGVGMSGQARTAFSLGSGTVMLGLSERTVIAGQPIPPKDPWDRPTVKRQGSSDLAFAIDGWAGDWLRRNWADGQRHRLEAILDRVLDGLKVMAEVEAQHEIDRRCRRRQEERAKARRAEAEQRNAREQKRRQELTGYIDAWQQAERIRTFLSTVRARLADGRLRPANEQTFQAWLGWATWYADHLDPTLDAKPPTHDGEPPKNVPVSQLDLTSDMRAVVEQLGVSDTNELAAITKQQIERVARNAYQVSCEIGLVLEGLGYPKS